MNQIHPSQFVLAWWGGARHFRKLELMHRSWQIHTAHQTVRADAWLHNSLSDNSLVAMRSAIIPFFARLKSNHSYVFPISDYLRADSAQRYIIAPMRHPQYFIKPFYFIIYLFTQHKIQTWEESRCAFSPLRAPLFWTVLSQFMQSTFISLFIYLFSPKCRTTSNPTGERH